MMVFALFALTVVVKHSLLRPYFETENFPPPVTSDNKKNSVLCSILEFKLDALAGKPDLKRQIGMRNGKKNL